jgi:glyoxylate/hydroxypyruvate reductase A
MTILCLEEPAVAASWKEALSTALPGIEVRLNEGDGAPEDVKMVVLWDELEVLQNHPNVAAAVILGAGVDHLLPVADSIPERVQVIRLVDDSITGQMLEWVAMAVLTHTRRWDEYRDFQQRKNYEEIPLPVPSELTIGILGAGILSAAVAQLLSNIGYNVGVWSRGPKSIAGVESYHGADGLSALMGNSDLCVCMLPLTDFTREICGSNLFATMKRGSYFINAARGAHVDERALIEALDSGQLCGATLDVQVAEPLPDDHPFWEHPKVKLTPHVATISYARFCAAQVADNYHRLLAGQPLLNVVDLARQY